MSEGISLMSDSDRRFQLQFTHFKIDPLLAKRCHESLPGTVPVMLRGSKTSKTTIGRGHDATVRIGRSNKRVSREHVVIEHKPQLNGFELTILSPNGALIDHIIFDEGEHVPIVEGTVIEIVGTKIVFQMPPDEEPEQENIPITSEQQDTTTTTSTSTSTNANTTTTTTTTTISIHHNTLIKSTLIKKPVNLEDEIIQILVLSRKSTMTCTDIAKRLDGHTIETVSKVLSTSPVIGCVKRLGKTADGSPKEDLYYYKPELDTNKERQKKYSDVGRTARKCTMKDTQYFFRIPPKLPNHNKSKKRHSSIQPAKSHHAKIETSSALNEEEGEEDEDIKSTSSGDVSDMEVYELFKDVD